MFIYKLRHENIRIIHVRHTKAANVYSFTREQDHNNEYKNSPFYKGALIWDTLPVYTRQCVSLPEF